MSAAGAVVAEPIVKDAETGIVTHGYLGAIARGPDVSEADTDALDAFDRQADAFIDGPARVHAERPQLLVDYAKRGLLKGIALREIRDGATYINANACFPRLSEASVKEAVQLAVKQHRGVAQPGEGVDPFAAESPFAPEKGRLGSRFTAAPAPRDYVLGKYLHAGTPHILAGFGGASKTQWSLEAACHIVLGLPYADMPTKEGGGAAVLVLGEEESSEVDRRMGAIADTYRFTATQLAQIDARLLVFPCAGQDIALTRGGKRGAEPTGLVDKLVQTCRDHAAACGLAVRFITLDHYLQVAGGELLSPEDGAAYGREAARLATESGAAVLTLAHMPKSSQNKEEKDQHDVAGAGSINNTGRGTITLNGMTTKEAKTFGIPAGDRSQYVKLACVKNNKGPMNDCVAWFHRTSHAYQVGVLKHVQLTKKAESAAPNDDALLNTIVAKVADQPGKYTMRAFGERFAGQWTTQDKPVGRPRLVAILGELVDAGRITLRPPTAAECDAHGLSLRTVREVMVAERQPKKAAKVGKGPLF